MPCQIDGDLNLNNGRLKADLLPTISPVVAQLTAGGIPYARISNTTGMQQVMEIKPCLNASQKKPLR
jgi:hypothetical protein